MRRRTVITAYLALSASQIVLVSLEFMMVAIQRDLSLSPSATAAVMQFAGASALLVVFVAGSLSDHFGTRGTLAAGSMAFCGGAIVVALSPGLAFLMIGLGLGGVGFMVMAVTGIAILNDAIPDLHRRALAFGVFAMIAPIVSIVSPLVTAVTIPAVGWRFVPATWIALAAITSLMALLCLDKPSHHPPRREMVTPSLAGVVLACLAITAALLATDPEAALVPAAGLIVSLALLFILLRRLRNPTLDLRIFRERGSIPMFAAYAVFSCVNLFLFVVLLLTYRYEASLIDAALLMIVPQVTAVVGALLAGRLSARWGSVRASLVALILASAASLGALAVTDSSSPWAAIAVLSVAAVPIAGAIGTMTHAFMDLAPADGSGSASSLRKAADNLGVSIGGLVSATVVLTALEEPSIGVPSSTAGVGPLTHLWVRGVALTSSDAFGAAGLICTAAYAIAALLVGVVGWRRTSGRAMAVPPPTSIR